MKEAKKRGLPNFRRTPEALAQIVTKPSRDLFMNLGILAKEEIDSRYHIRLERYIKDMLIEMHTLAEMANTMVLPAGYSYARIAVGRGSAGEVSGRQAESACCQAASEAGVMVTELQKATAALVKAIAKAESMHHDAGEAGAVPHGRRRGRDGSGARCERHARDQYRRRVVAAAAIPGDAVPV